MLIWPVIIIGVAIFILILSGPQVEIDGVMIADQAKIADQAQMHLIYLALLGLALVLFSLARMLSSGGRRVLIHATVWVGVVAGVATAYVLRDEAAVVIEDIQVRLMPSVALSRADGEAAELNRGWDGHYRAQAEVNGAPLEMLVDTGASMVLIPYEAASDLGIDLERLDFSVPVTTANGRSEVAPIRLSSIKVGPVAVFDVPAAVARPNRLRTALLGLSFIDMLDETVFKGGKLILRQAAARRHELPPGTYRVD